MPSRKIRGRTFAVASAWIGRPFGLMLIVITAACDVGPPTRLTDVTWPTSTPATRTGDGMCSSVSVVNTAFSWNGVPWNGSDPPNTK